jgi:hypothetical protein
MGAGLRAKTVSRLPAEWPYTPEIVVDSAASTVGSYREEVGSAIDPAKRDSRTATAVSIAKAGDQLTIDVGGGSGNAKV